MKPDHTQPIIATPKRPARLSPVALTLAPFASLPTAPSGAASARPVSTTNATKRPAAAVSPKRIAPAPAKAAAPAPKQYDFSHLADVTVEGPLLMMPTTPAPAPAEPDWRAVAAGWDAVYARAAARGVIAR